MQICESYSFMFSHLNWLKKVIKLKSSDLIFHEVSISKTPFTVNKFIANNHEIQNSSYYSNHGQ
jgi:hypothetical protein